MCINSFSHCFFQSAVKSIQTIREHLIYFQVVADPIQHFNGTGILGWAVNFIRKSQVVR